MCGIAGMAGTAPDREVLERMAGAIAHRGPDSGGFLVDEQAGFAFRRLSIIDVAGGDQPIFNEDRSLAIILNGEIYNYHDLRQGLVERGHKFRTRSDVETVLHLFEEKGERCLADLRGMFALAIWSRRDRSLFLARDRVGKKPLYYTQLPGGGIVFGSEIKAILQHPQVKREPDFNAINQFLTLQYVPTLGAFLSGGIDSSTVVAFAAEASSKPLNTFSIGFEPSDFDESRYARLVAAKFGTQHHELMVDAGAPELIDDIVWHYDQPFGDSSAIPSFHVARITRPHVTVVLNGDGGDESFAGYGRYLLNRYANYYRLPRAVRGAVHALARPVARKVGRGERMLDRGIQDPLDAYFATLVHLAPSRRQWLYREDFARQLDGGAPPPLAHLHSARHGALIDSMLDADVNNYLPDDLLVKMDVATMAYSLEARSPFLDHKVMEFMARVPAGEKLNGRETKHLLKRALRGIIPDEVIDRPKMGFGVPLAQWLRGSLKEMLLDSVLSSRALNRGFFKPEAVREMVDAHMAGTDRFKYILWDLLMLERWHRVFIDEKPAIREAVLRRASAG